MSGNNPPGQMAPAPAPASTEPLTPTLFPDIDPVLLVRTQASADTTTLEAMKAKALATGEATAAAGQELLANQQMDIVSGNITAPTPMPAPADTLSGGSAP